MGERFEKHVRRTGSAADRAAAAVKERKSGIMFFRDSGQFALGLMEDVTASQAWGVSGGVPAGVSVALKNGWLPFGGGWHINSVGRIRGEGRWYLIAILTSEDPSEDYGIETASAISSLVWRALAPLRRGVLGPPVVSRRSRGFGGRRRQMTLV